jgi:hypothetical protein
MKVFGFSEKTMERDMDDFETYERRMHIPYRRGFLSIIPAFLVAYGVRWALEACDIVPKTIWIKCLFLALLLLFWAPWHKTKPLPKN